MQIHSAESVNTPEMALTVTNLTAWDTFDLADDGLSSEAPPEVDVVAAAAGSGSACVFLLLLVLLVIAIRKGLIRCESGIRAVTDCVNAIARLTGRGRGDASSDPVPRDLQSAFPGCLTDDDIIRLRAMRVAAAAREQHLYAEVARGEWV